jgi:hypothetical protein
LLDRKADNIINTFLEIPDNDSTIVMDQIIGDVVNTAQNQISATPPTKKKKKVSLQGFFYSLFKCF